jgi:hypothetical protein
MKKCNACGDVLCKKEKEDNWAFNRRRHCNQKCANAARPIGRKYKQRKDKGIPKPAGFFKDKSNLGSKTKELWRSPSYKKRMSQAHKGKKQTPEQIEKRVSQMRGENHPHWRGGVTPLHEKIRKSLEYKLWRTAVFMRDNYTCVWCGRTSGNGETVRLHADHIKPFAYYPELRFAIQTTPTYGGRGREK